MKITAKENLLQLKGLAQVPGIEKYNQASEILSGPTMITLVYQGVQLRFERTVIERKMRLERLPVTAE